MNGNNLTTEKFITKAKLVHGDKYDYSLVKYINNCTKIKIICKEHGVFEQSPAPHLRSQGCPKCSKFSILTTTEEFIKKAKLIHGDIYDYSLSEYINSCTKIKILCSEHGIFEQLSNGHLRGQGCIKCGFISQGEKRKLTIKEFINRANLVHDNKYDYSLVDYVNNSTKVKIICPIHGIFSQVPDSHLIKHGCFKCGIANRKNNRTKTNDLFIKEANLIHDNKYDYSNVIFKTLRTKVKIICPEHGMFEQLSSNHLKGLGCIKCAGVLKSTTEEFIKKAKLVHEDKYDYSLVNYNGNKTKVKIICNQHGMFEQKPNSHLNGVGCPICKESKGEREIRKYLTQHNILFTRQKKYPNCKYKNQLPFDFYLLDYNICIEFNGIQHYKYKKKFHRTEEGFIFQQLKDKIKMECCRSNNIPLIIIDDIKDIPDKISSSLKANSTSII